MRTALVVGLLLVAVPAGVFAVARWTAVPAPPPATQVRNLLAELNFHPVECAQHGRTVTCTLRRRGGRCSLNLTSGRGGCTGTGRQGSISLYVLGGHAGAGWTGYPPQ